MEQRYQLSLFIFRRDLRLDDNTALLAALKQSEKVIPCFIFDPRQVKKNPFKSARAIQFMIESLHDLNQQLKARKATLYCFDGTAEDVVAKLCEKMAIEAVFFNKDYTPFSTKRDTALQNICAKQKVACVSYDDALLNEPQSVLKKDGTPYVVFTPYFRVARLKAVAKPQKNRFTNYFTGTIAGRIKLPPRDTNYKRPTGLSAQLKFTTVSVRQVYHSLVQQKNYAKIRQLYWRDFLLKFCSISHTR